MPAVASNMFPLGEQAPDFHLPDTQSGKWINRDDAKGEQGMVVMFICNHCPYVIHVRKELTRLAEDYQSRGIGFIAISANDISRYPQDSPELMARFAAENAFPFPYLYDESQGIAKAYQAACTPDFYLFDQALKCVYRGRLDASRPGNDQPVNGQDLRAAIEAMLSGKKPLQAQHPSIGCSIKWK